MRAVLDACVLVPAITREILLAVAGQGVFTPLWSAPILAEWARAAAREGAPDAALAEGEIARLGLVWPAAAVTLPDGPPAAGLWLPDAGDLHVLAAAGAGDADVIVTFNLRDFPRAALAPLGLAARSPDEFLIGCLGKHPRAVGAAIAEVSAAAGPDAPGERRMLRRAGLPRLGAALARSAGGRA